MLIRPEKPGEPTHAHSPRSQRPLSSVSPKKICESSSWFSYSMPTAVNMSTKSSDSFTRASLLDVVEKTVEIVSLPVSALAASTNAVAPLGCSRTDSMHPAKWSG